MQEVAEVLELTDEEQNMVRKAGIGTGVLVTGQRRVWLDLYQKLSPPEYNALHSDPVVVPINAKKRGVA